MVSINRASNETRILILRCLIEGMGVNVTARTAGASKNTVLKLLLDAGRVCATYQDRMLRDLPCQRVQADEAWSFIYAKEKNVPVAKAAPEEAGDVWTWVTICADTKIIPTWRVGDRSAATALDLFDDLRRRMRGRIQLTTDGYGVYLEAADGAFGGDVDYTMLVKVYGDAPGGDRSAAVRYSPGHCTGTHVVHVSGRSDPAAINTSYVERHNLQMRMSMRRYTRLTNAFSKKLENHAAMVAIYMFSYNFIKPHGSLKNATPAMAAGLAEWRMKLDDIVAMIDAEYEAARPKTRGPYKKRISK